MLNSRHFGAPNAWGPFHMARMASPLKGPADTDIADTHIFWVDNNIDPNDISHVIPTNLA